MIKLGVSGACGKMGQRIIALAAQDKAFKVTLALEQLSHSQLGQPAAGVKVVSDYRAIGDIDGLIDFSAPMAAAEHLKYCLKFKTPLVIGTTGLSEEQKKQILSASKKIPIVFSPNMSIGVNLLFELTRQAASKLPSEYKISMTEAHHIHKKDAPSGTAKFLADIVRDERKDADIAIKSIRQGEIIGDHEVIFESPWDIIKLSHSAKTRDIFALGALEAMKFLVAKNKGLYAMPDVLKIK